MLTAEGALVEEAAALREGKSSGWPMTPESKLVFELARTAPRPVPGGDLEAITDWRRVLELAAAENATVALRDYLRSESAPSVPLEAQRLLAILALDRELRMNLLEKRLEESLSALNAAGIDAMLLKGGALASTIYGSFAARPMGDVDVLVPSERTDEARALLRELGWAADPALPGDQSYAAHHHLTPLVDTKANGPRLEIHRALAPLGHPFRFTAEEIYDEARVVKVGTARALVMHPVHHAVHVAIHFAWSHMFSRGAWHAFRDLGALAATPDFDWERFVSVARAWGAASCCYWTLQLGRDLSGLPIPDGVLGRLRPRWPEFVRRALARHLANGIVSTSRVCPSVRLDQILWTLAMRPRGDGHGSIRPWSVSQDLTLARSARVREASPEPSGSASRRWRQSALYLSRIIA
jgi:hypothetical protein